MPCFKREKGVSFRPRRDKQNDRDVMAPKPVHPRALRFHGLFSETFVRQHLMVDERWTTTSLTEQFGGMTDLLSRRVVFWRYETKANRQRYNRESTRLKLQCRDGRVKLQNILVGDNNHKIRNYLINHKDMQRLYQKMPIHLVVDNINQRTFVLRKERDRLEFLLEQRKHEYRELLLDRAVLENRIKYQNEFVLEEELKSRVFVKKIENSNVRIKAIKTINATYKKMAQVLVQDAIFYEPILRSLDHDMEDQANFIKHILYLGMPAIAKFKELNAEYRQLEEKSRKNLQDKLQMLASLNKPRVAIVPTNTKAKEISASADPKRYVRETQSMLVMKRVLKLVEGTIKEVKFQSLCSQAKEIYPTMRTQTENNEKLRRLTQFKHMYFTHLEDKMQRTTVFQNVLLNNLSEEEINRLERISDLRKTLAQDTQYEEENLQYLKNRADVYVMLRVSFWNLLEILRHVDRSTRSFRSIYPNSYLKLPLLKFDMYNMHAAAPAIFEEDITKVLAVLKRKVFKLVKAFKPDAKTSIVSSKDKYHHDFLESLVSYEYSDEEDGQQAMQEEDLLQENKTNANIPSRKQIKAQSNKLLEQAVKLEES